MQKESWERIRRMMSTPKLLTSRVYYPLFLPLPHPPHMQVADYEQLNLGEVEN